MLNLRPYWHIEGVLYFLCGDCHKLLVEFDKPGHRCNRMIDWHQIQRHLWEKIRRVG